MKQILGALVAFSFLTAVAVYAADPSDQDFDRLDGTGKSTATVQVIEWEGNLEIHAYPKGLIQGLGMVLDKKNKSNPVMVISYRYPSGTLIRRAVLGISLNEGFKVFKDPTEDEFDKIVISNNGLASPLLAFRTDPAPTQLYPDGVSASMVAKSSAPPAKVRAPAQQAPAASSDDEEDSADGTGGVNDDTGAIHPFGMGKSSR